MPTPAHHDHEELAAQLLMDGKRKGAVKQALAERFGLPPGASHEIVTRTRARLIAKFDIAVVDTWLATAGHALATQLGRDRATALLDAIETYRRVLDAKKLFPTLRLKACVRIFTLTGLGWQHRLEADRYP